MLWPYNIPWEAFLNPELSLFVNEELNKCVEISSYVRNLEANLSDIYEQTQTAPC